MAYDKIVDSAALNANLTAIANAIRAKGGTSASLAFPNGMVEAINAITTGGGGGTSGGGLPAGVSAIDYGTFTLSSNATTQTNVLHNLGVVPDFAIWWLDGAHIASATITVAVRGVIISTGTNATLNAQYVVTGYNTSGKAGTSANAVAAEYNLTKNGFTARCNSTYPILAGLTYHWIAGTLNFVA
jgi:hypothetical protein